MQGRRLPRQERADGSYGMDRGKAGQRAASGRASYQWKTARQIESGVCRADKDKLLTLISSPTKPRQRLRLRSAALPASAPPLSPSLDCSSACHSHGTLLRPLRPTPSLRCEAHPGTRPHPTLAESASLGLPLLSCPSSSPRLHVSALAQGSNSSIHM